MLWSTIAGTNHGWRTCSNGAGIIWFCFALASYVELTAAQFEAITRWQLPVSLCCHPVIFWIFIHRSDSLSNISWRCHGNFEWSLRDLDGMKRLFSNQDRVAVCSEIVQPSVWFGHNSEQDIICLTLPWDCSRIHNVFPNGSPSQGNLDQILIGLWH